VSSPARRTAIAAVLVAVLGVFAAGVIVLESRERGQGLVPDRVQSGARDAVPDRGGGGSDAPVPQAACPADLVGCREVSGRILYVEAVDPDGDGDAHFVLADTDSVTGPGITVVDVRPDLRPSPLPGAGAEVTAAGTVESGSYGQSQVEAVAFESG
jgi:hypothetical protein